MPPSAALVTAQAPSSPRIADNNSAKTNTPAPASVAAPHRRLAQVDRCCCRRLLARAREGNAIKVYGASFLLIVRSGSPARAKPGILCARCRIWPAFEVDDPVAPSPAAAIGDATVSSVGHRPGLHRRPRIANNNSAKTNTPAAGQRRSTTPPARAGRSLLLPPLSSRGRRGGDDSCSRGASFLLIVRSGSPARAKPGILCARCGKFGRRLKSMTR